MLPTGKPEEKKDEQLEKKPEDEKLQDRSRRSSSSSDAPSTKSQQSTEDIVKDIDSVPDHMSLYDPKMSGRRMSDSPKGLSDKRKKKPKKDRRPVLD